MIISAQSMKNSLPQIYKAVQTPAFPGMRPSEIKPLQIASDFRRTAQQTWLEAAISICKGKIWNNVGINGTGPKKQQKQQQTWKNEEHGDNIKARGFRDAGACTFQ